MSSTNNHSAVSAQQVHDYHDKYQWLPPAELLARLDLQRGWQIADFGAGDGYLSIPIALEIIPGQLTAIDNNPAKLEILREKLTLANMPPNITIVAASATDTGLPAASQDLVLMANIWHELPDPVAALNEAARILKPTGRLAIVEWRADVGQLEGPAPTRRIGSEKLHAALELSDWQIDYSDQFGDYHFVTLATKIKTKTQPMIVMVDSPS